MIPREREMRFPRLYSTVLTRLPDRTCKQSLTVHSSDPVYLSAILTSNTGLFAREINQLNGLLKTHSPKIPGPKSEAFGNLGIFLSPFL